jgi:hypothetical protein
MLSWRYTSDEFVIGTPLQGRPLHLFFHRWILILVCRGGERAKKLTGFDIPNSDVIPLVLRRKKFGALREIRGN